MKPGCHQPGFMVISGGLFRMLLDFSCRAAPDPPRDAAGREKTNPDLSDRVLLISLDF